MSGTHDYPKVPSDVYRRHACCFLWVNIYLVDGKIQNVHLKKFYFQAEVDKIEKREANGIMPEII